MVNKATKFFMETYEEQAVQTRFLSSLAVARTYNSERVTVDIVREDDNVSIAITDLQSPGRANSADIYTNKEFIAPVHKEVAPLTAYNAIDRRPGQSQFSDPNYAANVALDAARVMRTMDNKIRRSIELQASQVLQTGVVDLKNADDISVYTIDYKMKASHLPTTGSTWGGGGDDPLADLESLAYQVHEDGRGNPNRLIFGRTAWTAFIRDSRVQALLDNRRIAIGNINRPQNIGGGIFHGDITIGSFVCECWTYDGQYRDPVSDTIARFVQDDRVIMLSDNSRIDLAYGAIPHIAPVDNRVLPFLPGRISRNGGDMTTNAWFSPDGDTLNLSVGTRPIYIPTAIDTLGCLDTVV